MKEEMDFMLIEANNTTMLYLYHHPNQVLDETQPLHQLGDIFEGFSLSERERPRTYLRTLTYKMPDGTESSKAGLTSGLKKFKKFSLNLGVKHGRSRSSSPSTPASHISNNQLQPEPSVRVKPTANPRDNGDSITRNRPKYDASVRDLWQAAFDTLTQEEKNDLKGPEPSSDHGQQDSEYVSDVVTLTKEKCAQYEAAGWHIKRKGKADINVRDKAKSLLCSVLTFKDLVDAGLKFDASGYGALVWSVVSFGLKVSSLSSFLLIVLGETVLEMRA